jgi:hypothetical protein
VESLSQSPSFIPHPHSPRARKRSGSPAVIVSFFLFIVSLALAAGVFFYTNYLEARLESKKASLVRAQESLDRSTAEELIRLSKRLALSRELLDSHVAVTPFFEELERLTLPSVEFDSLELSSGPGETSATLTGVARAYTSIALQSDEFGGSTYFKNPVFSNFAPTESGRVTFDVTFDIDPRLFSFARNL